ncbi:major royal jelly protein 1 [Neodiprion lecontei]|uniref:Major royal jelly protein 1 n=1 Tax=Neodiprion lecontei TaxID=441921 RepID=A0A6J0BJY7_NEOLC|nr:major royal jelly protein 1 [Neodiprion lecontei]
MNLILTGILAFAAWTSAVELETVYTWKYIDYAWPNDSSKVAAISAGQYNASNIILADLQPVENGLMFVATPRYFNNPASLSIVSDQTGDGGPLLEPYPSWDWHTSDDCTGITSVSRLATDDCNRLWIVDSGKIGDEQVCDAQIIVFDPKTNETLIREEIPYNLTHNSKNSSEGWLEIQVVKTEGDSCENVTAVIGDPDGHGIVIYNGTNMWRVENEIFAPNETDYPEDTVLSKEWGVSNFVMLPESFAVGPFVMFGPLLSNDTYVLKLSDLRSADSDITYYKSNRTLPTMVTSRSVSESGVLIGGYVGWQCVTCWNVQNPIALDYIVNVTGNPSAQDTFAVKVVKGSEDGKDKYWQITSTVPKYTSSTLDVSVDNFIISFVDMDSLVNGTACEVQDTSSNRTIEDTNFAPLAA